MRYRDPTLNTVKQLFGTAMHCGYPGCAEPLFRPPSAGELGQILNCRIAHICAASPTGPRWDPNMDEDTNRAAGNLLLLCLPHAEEIDTQVTNYPVALLRTWKMEQLAAVGSGEQITDDQAVEAIAASYATEISIHGDVLHFGGQGGNAVGAAGGGGAAIGAGAIGGLGGPAGARIELDGQAGQDYGAGGGGAGTIVPGLRDTAESLALEGAGHSSGVDGQPGGDSSFGAGETAVTARGGAAGRSGNPRRSTSEAFAVSALLAVKSVETRDGLAFVLGGAYQRTAFLNLPAEHVIALLIVIEAPNVPVSTYTFHVEVSDPTGTQRSNVTFPVDVTTTGNVTRIPRVLDLPVTIDSAGIWTVRARSDTQLLATLPIVMKLL
jgi:hypothetical protein